MNDSAQHWQEVYTAKGEEQTSWYRPRLEESLRLIDAHSPGRLWPAIDVGAGRSTLVDDLLARKYLDVTALDVSAAALAQSRQRLGRDAMRVRWLESNVVFAKLPPDHYGLWHDRAVFHFLTDDGERARYVLQATRALRVGGLLVLATFATDGPEKCSGLPVRRYDAEGLAAEFGEHYEVLESTREEHRTPFGTTQSFTYLALRRLPNPVD